MHLSFDPDFDGGAWPGPLGEAGEAVAGEAWVGLLGLIGVLEEALGIGGPAVPETLRVAQVARSARRTEGFWSASAEVDPIAVARRLLKWRDLLVLHGWQGEGTGRLHALAAVCSGVAAGTEDRLLAVRLAAESTRSPISRLTSYALAEELPPLLLRTLRALETHGTVVRFAPLTSSRIRSGSDLVRVVGSAPRLLGDDSLQLLRPAGVLAAADAVAAALAAADSLASTVIIGADPVLDVALHRHGLPRTGRPGTLPDNALLELLPLALRLSFAPPDPQRALELLTLPVSPLPRRLSAWLAHSLQEVPAVGSTLWRSTLAEALDGLEETHSALVAERFGILFDSVRSPRAPVSLLAAKTACLREWLGEWLAGPRSSHERAAIGAALDQLTAFETYLSFWDSLALSEAEVGQLLDEATRYVAAGSIHPAEAGLASVEVPGAIVGPARRIIWWDFALTSARQRSPSPFSASELRELAAAGVILPGPEALAQQQARRWRRPLLSAVESLVLVCPHRGQDGEPCHPHPLLDEILSRVPREERDASLRAIERTLVGVPEVPRQVPRPAQPVVEGISDWRLPPGAISRRPLESPRSVGLLLGCSLGWVLQYVAELRGGMTARLPEGALLHGKVAHALVEAVLRDRPAATVAEAEAYAGEVFDRLGPRLAASLFRPGHDRDREQVRVATRAATASLYQLMREGGFEVASIEAPLRLTALGTELEGRPDLVLRDPQGAPAVVDLKWGRSTRKDELACGTAFQLAAYSRLLATAGQAFPPAAYLILRSQELLTADPDTFPGSPTIPGPPLVETWRAMEAGHAEALALLESGVASAPGVSPAGERLEKWSEGLAGQRIALKPPCAYCALEAVCGRMFSAPVCKESGR